VAEVLQGVYAEKKLVNEVLGDSQGVYKFGLPVNRVIEEALASSPHLYKCLASIINLWTNQTTFKIVDDQIGYECLRLILLIAHALPSLPRKGAHYTSFI
jgi:hypothetical protein